MKNNYFDFFPGDTILSVFNWKEVTHLVIKLGLRSDICHVTMPSMNQKYEWSVQEKGTILRQTATDPKIIVLRPNDVNWKDIQIEAAKYAAKNPVYNYNWGGAGWLGVQTLQNKRRKSAIKWPPKSMFCFEWHTDIYEQIGYDIVPDVEPGCTTGDDILNSKLLIKVYDNIS